VDSSSTGGALSTVRVTLEKGADGARPHRHDRSAEMFYVLDGSVQVLSGAEIVTAEQGGVIVVPPRMPHAFSTGRPFRRSLSREARETRTAHSGNRDTHSQLRPYDEGR
jgi:uncharacterized RmlC-like cupin family protein